MSGRLVVFDLDGTLLSGDTDQLWCAFLVSEGRLDRAAFGPANDDVARRYAEGSITPEDFCAFYASTLAGRTRAMWQDTRARFTTSQLEPRVGAGARALVAKHVAAGDRVVVSTATSRFLAEPIVASLGVGELIATELALDGGVFSGRTEGRVNMRAGKVERVHAWLAAQGLAAGLLDDAVFYSDSINDLPLFCAVGEPIVVDPDVRLAEEARQRGWTVLRLER